MHERFSYAPFVIPYTIGFIFVIGYLIFSVISVFKNLPIGDKKKMFKHFFSWNIFITIKDIFYDCLLHVNIWKKNKLLGYMHSSIAFGWFMLIFIGHIEIMLYAPQRINLPYFPIFFRYFMLETETTLRGSFFFFLMDFFLLMVLSGVGLAIYKRFQSRRFGMKRTTKLKWNDQIAVYSLWAIFPLRFLAESFTSGISGGSFLTRGFGLIFENFNHFINNEALIKPFWWAYSIALMLFFFTLPWSRFTHILAEVLLIYMRNAGIRESSKNNGYAAAEIFSCSRCGMCIDPCQLASTAFLRDKTTVNYTRNTRLERHEEAHSAAGYCLMCNRCKQACPVGIDSVQLKLNTKRKRIHFSHETQYDYLTSYTKAAPKAKYDLVYFAGCMSHLTPGITRSMEEIFEAAKENYLFLDKTESICCGRPVLLAGAKKSAEKLIQNNESLIINSGAKTLVCNCPICYKILKEEYLLQGIEVLHHSEYILRLIEEKKIQLNKEELKAVYHDPCELGRNSGIYEQPRNVLRNILDLQSSAYDGTESLCCGLSIAAEALPYKKKQLIAKDCLAKLTENPVDMVATACPLCKRAFVEVNTHPIEDIAEIVSKHLIK